jgi:hypothetical protein
MEPRITFCIKCRGMETGWNKRYVSHLLLCKGWLHKSARTTAVALVTVLMFGFPKPGASVSPAPVAVQTEGDANAAALAKTAAEIRAMVALLKFHQVPETNRERLAESIVVSAKKHDLNPRLVASIMIVESRGNPYAISGQAAVGIMQVHLPTWGTTADRENINLLKIEDNVDFGARILKDYVRRYGVTEGIRRYNGYIPGEEAWERSSQVYLDKVQHVYDMKQTPVLQAALVK